MKRKIKKILREHYGKFQTRLELEYETKIVENLENNQNRQEWATYNQLLLELKHNIKDSLKVKELQYRITDVENPNDVCMDIIQKLKTTSPELERLADKIRNFN
jgi:hypothetical protein